MLSHPISENSKSWSNIRRNLLAVNENSDSLPPISERFDNLLIDAARVSEMMGRRSPGEVAFAQSEQGDARRQLLHVEKVAIENKQLQQKTEASLIDRVNAEVHQHVFDLIRGEIEDAETVLSSVLGLSEDVAPLLDVLSVRATSITRIESHASALPWLYDDLMIIVNTPKFRRKDSRGKIIPVETMRTALSFIGIENLRLLIPVSVLKRALPKITDPYPEIKTRLLKYGEAIGLSMRALAVDYSVSPHEAFTIGIFSQLGRSTIARLYFKAFEQAQLSLLREAEIARNAPLHTAMQKAQPSANYLIAMQEELAPALTAKLTTAMGFKRLRIALPFTEIAEQDKHPHDVTELLKKAQAYASIRMLHQGKFLEKSEIPVALHKTGFVRSERDVLKVTELFQLPLIDEDKI